MMVKANTLGSDALVSILIPAFNAQNTIARTLRSAISQTWKRKEIIVVDDGSTDGTYGIAKEFEAAGVRVTTQENQGAAGTRNKAFSLCNGEYIQWLDADDLLAPAKISLQMAALAEDPRKQILASSAWGRFLYRHERAEFVPTALWCDLSPKEWLIRKMAQNLHMQTATWLVSRELTVAAGPWNTALLGDDDGEYFCRVLMQCNGVRFVPGAKVYYRATGAGSLSYIGQSDAKLVAQLRSMELHIGYLRALEDSPRVRDACLRYLQNWAPVFYPSRPELFGKLQRIAEELGGRVEVPGFSWKYSWIACLGGHGVAYRAQARLRNFKWGLLRLWDRAMLRLGDEP